MKKLLAFAAGTLMGMSAYAAPAIDLPSGPVFIKFNGIEQIAAAPGATTYAGTNEINWGVILVSTIEVGKVDKNNQLIGSTGDQIFNNGNGGQITGMFYGVQAGETSVANPFPAVGGYLDLYWRDLDSLSKTTLAVGPDVRTDFDSAKGFTDGTFLARIMFDSGMDAGSSTNAIVGNTVPTNDGSEFTGIANSYGSVDVSAGGAWAKKLNSDWFNTKDGLRDLRFKNSYDSYAGWDGNGIRGANIQDPGQAFALPEPDGLALMGLAMAGMGFVLRRRKAAK